MAGKPTRYGAPIADAYKNDELGGPSPLEAASNIGDELKRTKQWLLGQQKPALQAPPEADIPAVRSPGEADANYRQLQHNMEQGQANPMQGLNPAGQMPGPQPGQDAMAAKRAAIQRIQSALPQQSEMPPEISDRPATEEEIAEMLANARRGR